MGHGAWKERKLLFIPIAHCPLPIAHCPLPIAQCPMPNAHCPTTNNAPIKPTESK
ncbi:hypothetical protein [Tolypothrix sp. VBCCA 56010]|uniref:hypothetical protein n=1 Tax=Tolypothrix sp. VBCCA 56010 TaxID=3137731 RepID=UPI003D7E61F6